MPDPYSEPAPQGDGLERPAVEGGVDERGSLDVPEWVSELRRLYVEPKTRAKLRQEGVIAPQKRKLGLPVGRGSRRTSPPPAVPAPDATPGETTDSGVAPPSIAPDDLRPAPLEPGTPGPMVEDSGEPYTPPGPTEEEKVASWLTSYLVATGHPAGEDERPAAPAATDAVADPGEPVPTDAATPATVVPAAEAAAGEAGAATEASHPATAPGEAGDLAAAATVPGDTGQPADQIRPAPQVVADPAQPSDEGAPDAMTHPRSLAELASFSELEPAQGAVAPAPEPSLAQSVPEPAAIQPVPEPAHVEAGAVGESAVPPALDSRTEVSSAAPERAGPHVSIGGDVATPDAAGTAGRAGAETAPEGRAERAVDATSAVDPTPDESLDDAAVETSVVPGRPSTVPRVTLSWREAESFAIGVPGAEVSEHSIVVEPPSQLVAQSRRRRPDVDSDPEADGDLGAETDTDAGRRAESTAPGAAPAVPEAAAAPSEPVVTRASTRAATGYRSGKRRRVVVVAVVLVFLAIVAWYFLLRENAGAGSSAHGGSSRTSAAAASGNELSAPGITL